jgi:hypothetical protein
MSTRTVRPSAAPCTGHDRFRTYGEFAAACTNIRPWDEAGLIIGECKRCRSTLSWEVHPTRWDEDERGPDDRTARRARRNPEGYFDNVPLEDLTDAQIRELPRSAFSEDEWGELTTSQQNEILEHPESQKRIDKLVDLFEKKYNAHSDPPNDWIISSTKDSFYQYLRERSDELVDDADDDEVERIIDANDSFPRNQVRRAISRALEDTGNYDVEVEVEAPSDTFHSESYYDTEFSIDGDEIEKAAKEMYEDEFDLATLKIDKDLPGVYRGILSYSLKKQIPRKFASIWGESNVEAEVLYNPDWGRIDRTVDRILDSEGVLEDEFEDDEGQPTDTRTKDERTVMRFPDGFYVLQLTPEEMKTEDGSYSDKGLSHCIGDPAQGFLGAVRKNKGIAWSVRRPSGKPLISIFAGLNKDGSIRDVEQVKGKSNRLVGWDLHKVGAPNKVKEHETKMVTAFIESLDVDPFLVSDLLPALSSMRDANPRWFQQLSTRWKPLPGLRSAASNPGHRVGVCKTCGGAAGGFCGK